MSTSVLSGSWKAGKDPTPQDSCQWLHHMIMQWTCAKTLSEGNSARFKFETLSSPVPSYVVKAQKLCPILPWNPLFNCLNVRWCQNNFIDGPYFLLCLHGRQYFKRLFDSSGRWPSLGRFLTLIWGNTPRVDCKGSWHGKLVLWQKVSQVQGCVKFFTLIFPHLDTDISFFLLWVYEHI